MLLFGGFFVWLACQVLHRSGYHGLANTVFWAYIVLASVFYIWMLTR